MGDDLAWGGGGMIYFVTPVIYISGVCRLHDLCSLSIFFLSTFCLKFDSIANTVQCSKFELIARKANRPITFVGLLSAVLVGAQPELLG